MKLHIKNAIWFGIFSCCAALILLTQSCQTPGINGVEDNSREYIQFEPFHVEKNFIRSDTELQIVFRNKEDEITFFEEHPIQSRFPFPDINYEHNDVVGICLGQRDARGASVKIDSVILCNRNEISVYTTEYNFETEYPSDNSPIKFAKIPKQEKPIKIANSKVITDIEPKQEIVFKKISGPSNEPKIDTAITTIIHNLDEEREYLSLLSYSIFNHIKEVDYISYDVIAISISGKRVNWNAIRIEDVAILNREVIVVAYSIFRSEYMRGPYTYALIPKYGLPVEFVRLN